MQIKITGKNIDVGDALRTHVVGRIEQVLDKLFDRGASGHVLFRRDGARFSSECAIHLDSGVHLQSSGESTDAYQCFDQAADRLEKRLRRYKRKLKSHHPARVESAPSFVLAAPADESEEGDEDKSGDAPVIVAESTEPLSTLAVSEAVMRMDLADASFFLFRNAAHGGLNIVYRRGDGNIGWIDPARQAGNTTSA